jgi:hypothetical protein
MTTAQPAGGGGLGFGLAFQLQDQFSQPAQNIQNSFSNLANMSDRLSSRISNSLNDIYSGMAQVGAGVAMMLPIQNVMQAYIEFDSLQRGMFAVMNNNIQSANNEIGRLIEVAKLPGLGFQEALQGSINVQAAGLSAD